MAYVGLGSRQATAVPDDTGNNAGRYTSHFTAALLGVKVPWYEIYGGVAEFTPPGTSAFIYVGTRPRGWAQFGEGGEYDPNQPILLEPASELIFYWTSQVLPTVTAPRVTLWLRYDFDEWGRAT